jgi:uncharacterized protein YggT (Ycf19 family)
MMAVGARTPQCYSLPARQTLQRPLSFSVRKCRVLHFKARFVRVQALQEVACLALDRQQASAIAAVLKPSLAVAEVFFIVRIVMSWDPQFNTDKKLPWSIFYKPTEPILAPTRSVIKPIGGVDISPIVWTFVISLASEFLLGPQGILVLIQRQSGV